MAMRMRGAYGPLALVVTSVLAIAGCGTRTPPPIANIPAPLPANIPLVETPPPPPVLINQSKGEDLWHLRSGLNVAVLLCQGPDNAALVASYNRLLGTHKGLLAAAAQVEVDLFKAKGGKSWQSVYDDHMTKVYNAYSGTLARAAYCARSRAILSELEFATPDLVNEKSTFLLWELNKAAGLPDPDGALARAAAQPVSVAPAAPASLLHTAPAATSVAAPTGAP